MTTDFERFIRDAEGELSANRDTLNMYEKERRDFEKRFRAENPRYQQVCDKCQQWREEVSFATRHLNRARQIAASSTAPAPETEHLGAVQLTTAMVDNIGTANALSAKLDDVDPVPLRVEELDFPPEPEPEQREVVTEKPSLPFPHGPFQSFPPAPAPVHAGFDRANAKRAVRAWRSSYPLAVSYRQSSRFERQALAAEIVNHPGYDAWLDEGNHPINNPSHKRGYVEILKAAQDLGIDVKAVRLKARNVHLDISSFGVQGVDYLWSDK